MDKPPYRVPLMTEIAALPWNGYNAISTFSGCGGSSLGYKMAGYRVLYANEFIPAAQETYRANHKGTILDTRDIRKVQPQDILDAIGKEPGELDLMDGSPPCASFSTAGKREAGWGKIKKYSDTKQRTDDLFFEFTRLLTGIQPKVFVAENVAGLVKGTAKGYFLEILAALKACGYRVKCKVLDAQWLGVPQMRQRTIFVGVREDIGLEPEHPEPLCYRYSVQDALPHIVKQGVNAAFGEITMTAANRPSGTIGASPNTGNGKSNPSQVEVTESNALKTTQRKLTIAELKRICAFPDDFILRGTASQQWERLGRAVPPVMMFHIAATVRDKILARLP